MWFIRVALAFILCSSITIGCSGVNKRGVIVKHKGHGPPPHVPAHGYRHKHQHGVELEYDSGLGLYIVVEMRGVYFHNGLYIRLSDGHWTVAAHFNGPWRAAAKGEVPSKLEKAKGRGHSGKGHTKNRGK